MPAIPPDATAWGGPEYLSLPQMIRTRGGACSLLGFSVALHFTPATPDIFDGKKAQLKV